MPEETIPWWRKALKLALGGIRSGFGLFSRTAPPETAEADETSSKTDEGSTVATQEEIAEEERELTEPFPQSEILPAAPAYSTEPAVAVETAAHSTPGILTPESLPAVEPVAAQAAGSVAAPVAGAVSLPCPLEAAQIDAMEPEPTLELDPVPEIELQRVETAQVQPEPEPVLAPTPVPEAQPEPEAEPALHVEAMYESMPEPVEESVFVAEAERFNQIEIVTEAPPEATLQAEAPAAAEQEPDLGTAAGAQAEAAPDKEAEPMAELDAAPEAVADCVQEAPLELSPTPVESAPLAEPESLPAGATAGREAPLVLTPQPTAEEAAAKKAEDREAARLAARQKKLDEGSEQSPFSVFVGQVYDGPLDLLLDLIRKQDIDIYDIPIARITAQFLAYVNQLKSSDVDVAGEFIYTASLLIHIKSKMLLPRAATGPDDAAEDPRRELVERLLEHERFKNAAQMLQEKQMLEAATWTNPGVREFKGDEATEPEIAADTVDLVRIFRDILERAKKRPVFNVDEDSVTVGQMIQFLGRRLTMDDKPVALRRLLSHTRSERALIAMFLALLELVRMQAILLRQDRAFSEIFIKKNTGFDAVMNDGLLNARDDWK